MKKRIISMVMVLALVFAMLPVSAIADGAGTGDASSVDIQEIVDTVKNLISSGDVSEKLDEILENLDYNELAALFAELIKDKVDITPVLDKLDMNEIAAVVKALVAGETDISGIIAELDTAQIAELIKNLAGDNEAIAAVLEQLDIQQIADVIKALVAGDADISGIIANLDTAQLVELIKSLAGDNETIGAIIEYIPMNTLAAIVKALVAGDADISGIIANLDMEELTALVTALIGDNEAIGAILDQLDTEQIVELIKALIAGDVDISGILSQLDPYQLVQVVAGLIGSELDVTDPKNVTVTETETASFSVKLNRDNIMGIPTDTTEYKYMWLEPEAVSKLDFSSIDFQNSGTVGIALKIIAKLTTLSLSETDTLNIPNTSMKDDGRSFVCLIYHIELGGSTMHITDEATLTVTPLNDCPHKNLNFVRGVNPTCTADGNIAYYECTTCHKLFEDNTCTVQTNSRDVVIPATGHTPVIGAPAVEPTCTETGSTAQIVCLVCGDELEAAKTIDANGHTKVVDVEAKDASCTQAGCTEGSHCSVCHEVLGVSEVIDAKGHTFEGIKCSVCGEFVPFPFVDVDEDAWFRGCIEYVWQHELMVGVTENTFEPDSNLTRAMFVQVLYRMAGEPSVDNMRAPFTDISREHWAYKAVVWAYNSGVTEGVSLTEFAPEDNITRAQLVTMLYRYVGSPAVTGELGFADADVISGVWSWSVNAVIWASDSGIVSGYTDGTFRPEKTATRAEMAKILQGYLEMP